MAAAHIDMQARTAAWSGRFNEAMDERLLGYNASIPFDYRLALHDIRASIAHARMLAAQAIIPQPDFAVIEQGLLGIAQDIRDGTFQWSRALEDVHFNIERRLTERIGDAGKRLHTARSRNDQVATSMRLYLREAIAGIRQRIRHLQRAFVEQASQHADLLMPGFTHLQVAQPVTFGHHLMAYFEMLERDDGRFGDCATRLNQLPLGSAALAGTSFPIDREAVAHELGFDGVTRNSMDSVSDRDFVLEFLAAAAVLMIHLSRLSEELILWSSSAFGFVALPDRFCTGSSIMPQKKNPDIPELARAKAGRMLGLLTGAMAMMKAQPLAYNKDNQETQEAMFDAEQVLVTTLEVFTGLVAGLQPNASRMLAAADAGYATATDLADLLVRRSIPFRDAHEVVARVVRQAEAQGCPLAGLGEEVIATLMAQTLGIELQRARSILGDDLQRVLSVRGSAESRSHTGGTAPEAVRREVARARQLLNAAPGL